MILKISVALINKGLRIFWLFANWHGFDLIDLKTKLTVCIFVITIMHIVFLCKLSCA